MKDENQQYHIDVTPEEDSLFRNKKQPTSKIVFSKNRAFWNVFVVVLGLHVAAAAAIGISTTSNQTVTSNGTNTANSTVDKKDQQPVIAENTKLVAQATPQPSSPPKHETTKVAPSEKKQKQQYTTEYTVKQGDTVTSIAKKYKLSTQRLLKINNIQDPNKLAVGQKLKFL